MYTSLVKYILTGDNGSKMVVMHKICQLYSPLLLQIIKTVTRQVIYLVQKKITFGVITNQQK